jgi:hypothetical protein
MSEDVPPYGDGTGKVGGRPRRLTRAQERRIYRAFMLRRRLTTPHLAKQYGVSKTTIENIYRRQSALEGKP